MVRMIPPTPRAGANRSEQALFAALAGIPNKPDWIVLHSTLLAQNIRNLTGEADFIVLAPGLGIMVIEAKAPSSVVYREGKWKLEGTPRPNKDPMKQLNDTRLTLRSFLQRNDLFDNAPMPRLLWITSIGWQALNRGNIGDLQFFDWEIAWRDALATPAETIEKGFSEFTKWHANNEKLHFDPANFTAEDAEAIVGEMLTDFEARESPTDRLVHRREVMRTAIDELERVLEIVEGNPRIYFEGAAGAGKSHLLQLAAKDLASRGKRTLVTCWNMMMADELAQHLAAKPGIEVAHLNAVMLNLAGLNDNPADANHEWFQTTLPQLAIAAIDENPALAEYDAVCVDEFQDIANNLLLLELIVRLTKKQRIDAAYLVLAGDELQQIMVHGNEQVNPFAQAKALIPDLVKVNLRGNYRNAPKLASQLSNIASLKMPPVRACVPDSVEGGVKVFEYKPGSQAEVLADVLKDLLTEFRPEDIRILSPFNATSLIGEFMARIANNDAERYLKGVLRFKTRPGVRWRSIAKFKGLESDVVILTDVDQRAVDFYAKTGKTLGEALYVGASRARHWCIILTSDGVLGYRPPKY